MTERKDFKRIVRARASRTGESYSSALRHVRHAGHGAGPHEEARPISITRTIPDIRSTKIEATTSFYTEVLGFDLRNATGGGPVVAFVSPPRPDAEVTLNRDGFTLPAGFTVEVDSVSAIAGLYERRAAAGVRTVEELRADGSQFSVLDPSGRRVSVALAGGPAGTGASNPGTSNAGAGATCASADLSHSITRVIPGVDTNEPNATRQFYAGYLGLEVWRDWEGITLFRSPAAPGAQVIASTRSACPVGFDLMVDSRERLEAIRRAAQGRSVVLHEPYDFPEQGIRCFLLLDPNGIGVNVAAPLGLSG